MWVVTYCNHVIGLVTMTLHRPRFCALWSRAIGGWTIIGRDYYESNSCKSSYCGSNHCQLSYQKCSVNERRGRYGPWISDHPSSHLWLSFLRTASGSRRNSPFNELCTYIRPFIRTSIHLARLSKVTSRPSTLALLLQDIYCNVTLLPKRSGRSWCWRLKSQV